MEYSFLCVFLFILSTSIQEDDIFQKKNSSTDSPAICSNSCANDGVPCCRRNVVGTTTTPNEIDIQLGSSFENEVTTVYPPFLCSVCTCVDAILDCSKRDIVEPFTMEEWNDIEESKVKEVNLSYNTLNRLSEFPSLSIEILNISNNRLESIDNWCFYRLENLTVLDLSVNRLSDVSKKAFWVHIIPGQKEGAFKHMRYLSLASNDMHVIPKDIFAFMNGLTFLDLSWNALRIIDQVAMGSLSELKMLKELRLKGCGLETLPEGLFRTLKRLHKLDLSSNKFSVIPEAMGDAFNLVFLNLDDNPISTLVGNTSIVKLTKLQELHLCNTALQSIGPSALGGLKDLEILHISNNAKLSEIDEDFLRWKDENGVEKWPTIRELYLQNNNMTSVDPDYLLRWDQLKVMDYSGNPYICDCTNQWMVDVLVPLIMAQNGTASDMVCLQPQGLRGLTFSQLYEKTIILECQVERLEELPSFDMAIILGIMIGIFVTLPAVLIVVLLWKKGYYAKCRQKLKSDEYSDEENDAF